MLLGKGVCRWYRHRGIIFDNYRTVPNVCMVWYGCVLISAAVREISCRYLHILSQTHCHNDETVVKNAAKWQLMFAQRLAAQRVGFLQVAHNPVGIDFIEFPDCSADTFHTDGIHSFIHS